MEAQENVILHAVDLQKDLNTQPSGVGATSCGQRLEQLSPAGVTWEAGVAN